MALKYLLNSSSYEALSEELKKEYIAGEKDGEYILDVSGIPQGEDTGPLKRANERLREENKGLKKTNSELQAKVDEFPDVDAIEKTHQETTKKLTDFAQKTLVKATADSIAKDISKVPALMSEAIAKRLSVDMSGDEPRAVVLGADGKPNKDLTLEALKKEFVENKEYAPIIIQSKASGGGAPQTPAIKPFGGGAAQGEQQQAADLSKLPGKDLAARIAERKAAQTA